MSRGYRVRVRRGVRVSDELDVDCTADDEVRTRVEVLEILPREQMAGLLAGELARRGFAEHAGRLERTADGVTVTVDPETGAVAVRAASTGQVHIKGSRETEVTDWSGGTAEQRRAEGRLREELRRDLRRQAERQAQEQVSGRLEAALGDVAAELDRAVNRVTAEALKQKAAQIGRVKELAEDPDSGSLSITVEV